MQASRMADARARRSASTSPCHHDQHATTCEKMLLILAVICATASVTSLVHRTYYIVVDLLLCNIVSRYFSTNMVMLKGIPRVISPQLLSVLSRMGHGDEIGKIITNYPIIKPEKRY